MYDVAIIGGGPAGASAATFTARTGLNTVLVDADQSITRRAWIPNHLGFPDGISGPDLVDRGKQQAQRAGARLVTGKVVDLEGTGPAGFRLRLEDGTTLETRSRAARHSDHLPVYVSVGGRGEEDHHRGHILRRRQATGWRGAGQ